MSTTARNVKLSIAYLFHGEIRQNLNLSNISDSVALSGNVSAGFLFNRSSNKVVYHQPINFLVDGICGFVRVLRIFHLLLSLIGCLTYKNCQLITDKGAFVWPAHSRIKTKSTSKSASPDKRTGVIYINSTTDAGVQQVFILGLP